MSTPSTDSLIPESRREAVAQALRQTFGTEAPHTLSPLHGGQSGSHVLKLTHAERAYVLRILPPPTPLNDPKRHFACVRVAAERGITPPVYFADAQTGISITGYIEAQPARLAFQADPSLLSRFGEMLRRLHTGPAFPVFLDALQMIQGGVGTLTSVKFPIPELVQTVLARFETIQKVLQPHLISAPCHNDLNPSNLLFDGDRLWLIDWETACMGDPFFDLSSTLLWFNCSPEEEAALLRGYFEGEPDARQRAKLELMRQVSRCFYSVVFLLLTLQGGGRPTPPPRERLPRFTETVKAVESGAMKRHSDEHRFHLSLILANEALLSMERPEFARALDMLSGASS